MLSIGCGGSISLRTSMHGLVLILLACARGNEATANPPLEVAAKSDYMSQEFIKDLVHGRSAAASIAKHRKWRKTLPRCGRGISWLREDWPDSGVVDRVRGVLYPGGWRCTAMWCNTKCCNHCGSELKFIPRAEMIKQGARGKGLPLQLAGESQPMEFSGMDCAIDSLDNQPLLEVVVSGMVDDKRERMIVNAGLCVLDGKPE